MFFKLSTLQKRSILCVCLFLSYMYMSLQHIRCSYTYVCPMRVSFTKCILPSQSNIHTITTGYCLMLSVIILSSIFPGKYCPILHRCTWVILFRHIYNRCLYSPQRRLIMQLRSGMLHSCTIKWQD